MGPMVDDESPRARLVVLLQHFSELGDEREAWRVVYPIAEVLLLVTCATVDSCEDIVEWGRASRFPAAVLRVPPWHSMRALAARPGEPHSHAALRAGSPSCGWAGMTPSLSTARPCAAPTIIARGSKPCTA